MTAGSRIAFGRGVCGNLAEAASREWIVTDGLGGYANGTIAGLRTRRYHGLLVAPTAPAGASRMLGLAALDVVVVLGDQRIRLATHEWGSGVVDPAGYQHLASFDLDDGVPRWRYDLGPVQLEVEVAMAQGSSTVAVVHRLLAGRARLEVTPLCTWRDQHGDRFAAGDPQVESTGTGFVFESAYRVHGPGFVGGGEWYRGEYHREEVARGLGASEDLWAAGTFAADLTANQTLAVTATVELGAPAPAAEAIVTAARARAGELAARAGADTEVDRILAVAADRFVVQTPNGPTAVAGYPWFGEWSRDLFTSYEGLFLATGRADEGRAVLERAAGTVSQGMLANTADVGTLEYNTIDATLWFLHALGRHVEHTGDTDLAAQLADTVVAILTAHRDGTRFGIGVDAATGLLHGGAQGWALTWMDARVDGVPITPRAGFPVEVEALWINGLGAAADLLGRAGRDSHDWTTLRKQALTSFGRLSPTPDGGLVDVLDPAGTPDPRRRPNQLLAASLPHGPVQQPRDAAAIVAACDDLVTSVGLRSLAPSDPGFRGQHRGGPAERDAAYHQGTVWPWLIGPYVDAARRAGRDTSTMLDGLELHLSEFGLGSVSETADGDAPHGATGCPFQAWSVAELIRARWVQAERA
ncbi:amylo-alpha-1,6-glucosidase [Angustibacter sp. McL0619]|uniref:amylo-alpha-1,6-glucosidase n=1 Tax=Angustibacter sp. McL0619 TaxID=3415676 RepID=UPI003CEC78E1